MNAFLSQENFSILLLISILLTCLLWTNADDEYEDIPRKENVETFEKKSKLNNIGVGNDNSGDSEVNIGHGHSSDTGWSILNTKVLSKPKIDVNRAGFVSGKGANQPDRDVEISVDGEKKAIKI